MRIVLLVTMSALAAGLHRPAHAASCVGGAALQGPFGVVIDGPVNNGSTSEAYTGILTADGACGLSGTLSGGMHGSSLASGSATGSYTVMKTGAGTMTLVLPGSATVDFDIGTVKLGTAVQLTGIAADGPATATIEMVAIDTTKTYTAASILGNFISTCIGAQTGSSTGFGVEADYFDFDGKGGLTVSPYSNNGGTTDMASFSGSYAVGTDGSFTIGYPGAQSRYVVMGEIVNKGTELRQIYIDTAGYDVYRSCFTKKLTPVPK